MFECGGDPVPIALTRDRPPHGGGNRNERRDMAEQISIEIAPGERVSALVYPAAAPSAGITLLLAHDAGAGQGSDFMIRFATGFSARGIDAVTFNFCYTEQDRRVPDPNRKLEACYRAVIERLHSHKSNKLAIGGKSMTCAQSIWRRSKFRCCSCRARATPSARPTSCGRSCKNCRLPGCTSWRAATIRSRCASATGLLRRTCTKPCSTVLRDGCGKRFARSEKARSPRADRQKGARGRPSHCAVRHRSRGRARRAAPKAGPYLKRPFRRSCRIPPRGTLSAS